MTSVAGARRTVESVRTRPPAWPTAAAIDATAPGSSRTSRWTATAAGRGCGTAAGHRAAGSARQAGRPATMSAIERPVGSRPLVGSCSSNAIPSAGERLAGGDGIARGEHQRAVGVLGDADDARDVDRAIGQRLGDLRERARAVLELDGEPDRHERTSCQPMVRGRSNRSGPAGIMIIRRPGRTLPGRESTVQSALVERARTGDEEAFASLARAAGDRLLAIAYRILRDLGLAEDAVQQTLVLAWRELPSLRDVESFDAWLHRLLVNACYREARRGRRWAANVRVLQVEPPAATDEYRRGRPPRPARAGVPAAAAGAASRPRLPPLPRPDPARDRRPARRAPGHRQVAAALRHQRHPRRHRGGPADGAEPLGERLA